MHILDSMYLYMKPVERCMLRFIVQIKMNVWNLMGNVRTYVTTPTPDTGVSVIKGNSV